MGPPLKPTHLGRYRDLAVLLARYGRSDAVRGLGWGDALPVDPVAAAGLAGDADEARRLAADLERMGPTYVKLGQLLASRVDLLPPAYTEALRRLHDRVEPVPYAEIEEVVRDELGVRLSRAFARFDEKPVASASLGQVHRAALRDGRPVVVKVQRPGIRAQVRDDMEVLEQIASWLDRHTDAGRLYGFQALLDEFRRSLAWELDYQREAQNLAALADALSSFPRLLVPRPVADYTTSRVLTMDEIRGHPVDGVSPVVLLDADGAGLADELVGAYLHQVLVNGFFHADPHAGNLLLTPDGQLALLDVGQVAHVPARLRDQLVRLLVAVSEGDGEEAAAATEALGEPQAGYDERRFRTQVGELVTASASRSLDDVEAGGVLLQLTRISGRAGLRPPPELAMLGKAMLNLDQVTRTLDPSFQPAAAMRRHVTEIMRAQMRPRLGSMLHSAMEVRDFATHLPGRLNRVMDLLARGEFSVKVDAIDETQLLHGLQKIANRLTTGVVVAALIVGAALLVRVPTTTRLFGYPAIAIVCFLLAAAGAAALLVSIAVSDRDIRRRSRRDRRGRD